jgi:hypothetical protein
VAIAAFIAFVEFIRYQWRQSSPVGVLRRRLAAFQRQLTAAPLQTTAEFPENTVGAVQGALRYLGDAPLVAPLTGRPCAYYEVIVEQPGLGEGWEEVIRESQGQDFLLEDDGGLARVRVQDCEVRIFQDAHFRTGLLNEATPELETFLAKHGRTSTSWSFTKSMRFREGVLEEGETVAVCGYGTREVDPDPRAATGGYRDNALRLVLSARSDQPLLISDDYLAAP